MFSEESKTSMNYYRVGDSIKMNLSIFPVLIGTIRKQESPQKTILPDKKKKKVNREELRDVGRAK